MAHELSSRIGELLADRTPFVQATVVRAEPPTSARAGDEAVVLADGSIEGFVGGQCAEESVRAAAVELLDSGDTLLLRVLPEGAVEFPDTTGARVVVNPCLSGGAIEIFLAARLPAALITIVGETPIADALATIAETVGFVFDSTRSLAARSPGDALAVIVCSHGHDEPESIRSALDAGVGFIGLVASRKRGEAVLGAMDLTTAERARIHTPVGLDIGARTAEEIALSIMAEIVMAVRSGELKSEATPIRGRLFQAVDPVCGMTVVVGSGTPHREIGGIELFFCSSACRDRYSA